VQVSTCSGIMKIVAGSLKKRSGIFEMDS